MIETKQELSSKSLRKDGKLLLEHNPEISLCEPLILVQNPSCRCPQTSKVIMEQTKKGNHLALWSQHQADCLLLCSHLNNQSSLLSS